jgi:hypothetical protein
MSKYIVIVLSWCLLYCAAPKDTVIEQQKCSISQDENLVIINCNGDITQIDLDEAEDTPNASPTPEPNWWVCKEKHDKKWFCRKE